MKKAFKLLLVYILYSIIGVLIGTAAYSLYVTLLNYVEGHKFVLFDFQVIKGSFFYIAACLVFYMTSVVAYTRIRYKSGVAQLIVFLVVSAISWGLVFPTILHFGQPYLDKNLKQDSKKVSLSENYFRKAGENVYFQFESLQNNSSVSVIKIDTTQEGDVSIIEISSDEQLPLIETSAPYRDVLIADNFNSTGSSKTYAKTYIDRLLDSAIDYELLIDRAINALAKGWTFWLGFLSLGLLLCSIYGLSSLFNWKLLNACTVMLVTLIVLSFNTVFYTPLTDGFKSWKMCNFGFIHAFGNYVDEPVLVIFNLFFTLIFTVTGIVRFAVTRKKSKRRES